MKKKKPDYSCWKIYDVMYTSEQFLELVKPYKHIRVGVATGQKEPFKLVFFKVAKKELIEHVRMDKSYVTLTVMVDPRDPKDVGTMFIREIRSSVVDEIQKSK